MSEETGHGNGVQLQGDDLLSACHSAYRRVFTGQFLTYGRTGLKDDCHAPYSVDYDALNEENMEKIIDYVKRSMDELKLNGGEPSKLQMNMATFYMMLEEMDNLNDVVAIENLGRITYFVCGLAFEERNDIAKGTVFIVS